MRAQFKRSLRAYIVINRGFNKGYQEYKRKLKIFTIKGSYKSLRRKPDL